MNPFRPYLELKTVIVNLKSGSAFKGVIFNAKGKILILKNSALLSDRGQRTEEKRIDGDLVLFVADVDFVQVL